MLDYFNVALFDAALCTAELLNVVLNLRLDYQRYTLLMNVLLIDARVFDIAPFNVALFNVHYLILRFFMLHCLVLH